MDITGEYTIPASKQQVWDALNDPEVLKVCIPGCEEMVKISDTELTAKVTVKIGAVRAKLKGEVTLSEIDAPNSYKIMGSGKGGIAGFAKGGATVSLADADGGGTKLSYVAQAELGGKLAAVGSRVIQGVSKKMADDFFGKFVKVVTGETEEKPSPINTAAPVASVNAIKPDDGDEGIPGWLKGALVHAMITVIAVFAAVSLASN